MKRHVATALLAGVMSIVGMTLAAAQEMYVGEVRLFAFNWCPMGWLQASGQTLPINQYTPLFALIGTTYGGNGSSTFNLPNLSGRAPYGQFNNGQGQPIGTIYGSTQVTLTVSNLPSHTHQLYGSSAAEGQATPAGALLPTFPNATQKFYTSPGAPNDKPMAVNAVGFTGGNLPVSIQSPALSMNWCIATQGIFPSRP
ncbi:MAG TPA: tail fiber protein [Candidatus Saccharimonadales bacterium]|nr:tail fiber protein [Candidatus Saccharimonadales bacterium]